MTGASGLGNGIFGLSTLNAAMARTQGTLGAGLILGAWGSAQATAAGLAILAGGTIRRTDIRSIARDGPRSRGS